MIGKKKKRVKEEKTKIAEPVGAPLSEAEVVVNPRNWKIHVPNEVYERLLHFAHLANPNEIQFLADVHRDGNGFFVEKFHLIEQKVDRAEAHFDLKALALFTQTYPDVEKVRCWIHSHVDMGNFWSGADEATIARHVKMGGWLVSIVMCINGKLEGRVDAGLDDPTKKAIAETFSDHFDPDLLKLIPMKASWQDIPVVIGSPLTFKEREKLADEFNKKVVELSGIEEVDPSALPAWREAEKGLFKNEGTEEEIETPVVSEDQVQCDTCEFDEKGAICGRGVDRRLLEGNCGVYSPMEVTS